MVQLVWHISSDVNGLTVELPLQFPISLRAKVHLRAVNVAHDKIPSQGTSPFVDFCKSRIQLVIVDVHIYAFCLGDTAHFCNVTALTVVWRVCGIDL